jgi:hypothetical protein
LLGLHDLATPSRSEVVIEGVTVDLAFDTQHAVVLFDAEPHGRRDTTALVFAGWHVIHIAADDSLEAAITSNPTVFGRTS